MKRGERPDLHDHLCWCGSDKPSRQCHNRAKSEAAAMDALAAWPRVNDGTYLKIPRDEAALTLDQEEGGRALTERRVERREPICKACGRPIRSTCLKTITGLHVR